ncbi:hypothetical protein GOP47_0015612 [Adiantum capillus-veneris]|uniref:Pentatricopeptide repeat-containing protein n=1 Tax=Adiantum capillus-veneris TaxID=13818 RepID=A0A9D4ZE47_ADICA|nr:hypothetical protein GOP47_0015612 [Adiantum capillus-veneris]
MRQLLPASSTPILWKDSSPPDLHTLAHFVRACSDSKNLTHGRFLHHHIVHCSYEHNSLLCSLFVQFYAKCASLDDAEKCFFQYGEKTLESWNCLIGVYADHGKGNQGFKLVQRMQCEAVMGDNSTMHNMLIACTNESDLTVGRQIHVKISSSVLEHNVVIATALVNMYGKVGSLDDSQQIFHNMNMRNVVIWSCMISLYTKCRKYKDALQSFDNMLQEGVLPNTFTFVSIICACSCQALAKIGKTLHARLVGSEFEQHPYVGNAITNMYSRGGDLKEAEANFSAASKQLTSSWNTILAAYANYGKCKDSIKLFYRMLEEKILPDATTFINLLSACANEKALVEGMDIHTYITLMGLETDIAISNTLLNVYGKCNRLDVAKMLLNEMPEHDIISWNTFISGYTHHSLGIEAFHVFQQMIQEGMSPNLVTYTCILDGFVSEDLLAAGSVTSFL